MGREFLKPAGRIFLAAVALAINHAPVYAQEDQTALSVGAYCSDVSGRIDLGIVASGARSLVVRDTTSGREIELNETGAPEFSREYRGSVDVSGQESMQLLSGTLYEITLQNGGLSNSGRTWQTELTSGVQLGCSNR